MSHANQELTDDLIEFYRTYYRDEVAELAQRYPSEQTRLKIDYGDLHQYDSEIAEDWLAKPQTIGNYADEALRLFDLPADVNLANATVELVGLDAADTHLPNELSTDNTGYVAVWGKLGRVSSKDETATEAVFECQRCGGANPIPQTPGELEEPHECVGCERQGPFEIDDNQSDWDDYCDIRIETPPDESGSPQPEHIDGYCVGDVVHTGGEYGLLGRAGESVVAYGEIERHEKDDGLFERVLRVRAVEFPDEDDSVNIETHREAFEELAERDDAPDLLAESIAPALYQTDAWATAMEWAVTYLFAAPRIELPDGTSYRGDIHGAIISDYGMGKSMFSHGLETLSPDCIRKSATALSSDVGLTAAAVQDDFANGKWTLKPGILVRGNGGHVILDEIDKGPDDLESINDALEGQQRVDVEKAGLSAEYNSRTGVLVMGNPQEGRFDPTQPVAPQIGVDSSLLSRFDGVITMSDNPDADIDAAIAEQIGDAYAEANQLEFGDRDGDDLEALDRPVPTDVAQAWIKEARENCHPVFDKDLVESIKKWYAEEVRPMNRTYAGEGQGEDMPVPATARVVMWVIRFATAFARCHLRDEVAPDDIERAQSLARRLVGQNWDGEKFDPNVVEGNTEPTTQEDKMDAVKQAANRSSIEDIAAETGLSEAEASKRIDKLLEKGEVYEPEQGVFLKT